MVKVKKGQAPFKDQTMRLSQSFPSTPLQTHTQFPTTHV